MVLKAVLVHAHGKGWPGADAAKNSLGRVYQEWFHPWGELDQLSARKMTLALMGDFENGPRSVGVFHRNTMRLAALRGLWPRKSGE